MDSMDSYYQRKREWASLFLDQATQPSATGSTMGAPRAKGPVNGGYIPSATHNMHGPRVVVH